MVSANRRLWAKAMLSIYLYIQLYIYSLGAAYRGSMDLFKPRLKKDTSVDTRWEVYSRAYMFGEQDRRESEYSRINGEVFLKSVEAKTKGTFFVMNAHWYLQRVEWN